MNEISEISLYDLPPGFNSVKEIIALIETLIPYAFFDATKFEQEYTLSDGTKGKWYPVSEMLENGSITLEWLENKLHASAKIFAEYLANRAVSQYADHVGDDNQLSFLAWGIEQKMIKQDTIDIMRFDHGEGTGAYRGENFVKKYGQGNIIARAVSNVTDIETIRGYVRTKESDRVRSLLRQTPGKVYAWCEGCPC